jgi:DUF1009 family protein
MFQERFSRRKVGIIAGKGEMPFLLAASCVNQNYVPVILFFQGITEDKLKDSFPFLNLSLGKVSQSLNLLSENGISTLTMAGQWGRPSLKDLYLDKGGWELVGRLGWKWTGDDHVLRIVVDFLSEKGFELLSPQSLMQGLVSKEGSLTRVQPRKEHFQDLEKAKEILLHMSCLDIGQGLAIQEGLVLGIEAAEGTDQCIIRTGPLQRTEVAPVYVKMAKKQQLDSADLPVVGPCTVKHLASTGFGGLFYGAGRVLWIHPLEMIQLANEAGLFLYGF